MQMVIDIAYILKFTLEAGLAAKLVAQKHRDNHPNNTKKYKHLIAPLFM